MWAFSLGIGQAVVEQFLQRAREAGRQRDRRLALLLLHRRHRLQVRVPVCVCVWRHIHIYAVYIDTHTHTQADPEVRPPVVGLGRECGLEVCHLVERAPQRPDIRALVVRPAVEDFGCHA